jgi:hypothetical protein
VNPYKPGPNFGRQPIAAGEDPMMDFRARLAQSQAEAAERRRNDLAEQSSRLKTAEERIRIWERIHEVTLPRDPAHRENTARSVISMSTTLVPVKGNSQRDLNFGSPSFEV